MDEVADKLQCKKKSWPAAMEEVEEADDQLQLKM